MTRYLPTHVRSVTLRSYVPRSIANSFSTVKNVNFICFAMLQVRVLGLALHERELGLLRDLGRRSEFRNEGRRAYAGCLQGMVA